MQIWILFLHPFSLIQTPKHKFTKFVKFVEFLDTIQFNFIGRWRSSICISFFFARIYLNWPSLWMKLYFTVLRESFYVLFFEMKILRKWSEWMKCFFLYALWKLQFANGRNRNLPLLITIKLIVSNINLFAKTLTSPFVNAKCYVFMYNCSHVQWRNKPQQLKSN